MFWWGYLVVLLLFVCCVVELVLSIKETKEQETIKIAVIAF